MQHRDIIGIAALAVFVGLAMLLLLEHQMLHDLKTDDGHKIIPPDKPKRLAYQINTPVPATHWRTIDGETVH